MSSDVTSDRAQMVRGQTLWDLSELFLSSSGRMSRGPFLAVIAVVLALFWLYDQHVGGVVRTATGWLVDLLLLFSGCCAMSKRLHDRGRAGWWAGLVLLAFILSWPRPVGAVGWTAFAVLVLCAIELAVLPGRKGFNRFGP
jgi:uncharacterized membrane protein YhaH (DUF805 family)